MYAATASSFAGRYEKKLLPEIAVVVATDIIEPCSTLGRGEKNKLLGSRKTKSAGHLDVLFGLYKKIGALETQNAGGQSSTDSKEINLEAVRQREKARVRMDAWKAEQYIRLKRA